MGAQNSVIAGDYQGKMIKNCVIWETAGWNPAKTKFIPLNKDTVEDYTLITEEVQKSAASGVIKGAVGGALLGPIGLLAGSVSGKNKGIYTIAIQFKDGKRSLIEIDEVQYKKLISQMF